MKNQVLALATLALALSTLSCSKNIDVTAPEVIDPNKLYDVRFSVSGFTETHSPFEKLASTKSTGNTTLINKLLYVILDKDLLPIDTVMRDVQGAISTINVKLPLGKYSLRAIGYNTKLDYSQTIVLYAKYNNMFIDFRPMTVNNFNSYKLSDVFILHKDLDVTKDSTYSNLELSRLNSKLELNIQDEIPSAIRHIELSVSSSSNLYGGTATSAYKQSATAPHYDQAQYKSNFINVSGLANLTNQTVSTNILTPGQSYTGAVEKFSNVKINAYDAAGKLVVSKEVLNVKFIPNTITNLSGKLFENLNSEKNSALAVTINENYSTNIIKQQF